MPQKFKSELQLEILNNANADTDEFLVADTNGVIKFRTGAELLSDIGGASASGYVPYTGATANLDLGINNILAAKGTFSSSGSGDTFGITHSSGSGIALNITKGGNGEGLYINKTSGSGNAATIIGTLNATTLVKSGGTSSQFLKADGSVDSTSYGTGSVTSVGLSSATSGVTIGSTPITTSGTITLAIATASGSQQGLLSSTDWTTFNNKQSALTNPVTGTGTTNYLPKFTGASTIGNSLVFDNGTNVGIGTATPSGKLHIRVDTDSNVIFTGEYQYSLNNATNAFTNYTLSTLQSVFATNGAERMRITSGGNVGIGTTSPTFKLDVKQSIDQNGIILRSNIDDSQLRLVNNNSGYWQISATYGTSGSYQPITFLTSDTERMRITSNGGVNIATTTGNSISQLNVQAGATRFIAFEAIAAGGNKSIYVRPVDSGIHMISGNYITGSPYLPLALSARENNADLYLGTDGNIGIGTTSPDSKLTVQGSGYVIKALATGSDSVYLQTVNGSYDYIAGIATSLGYGLMGMNSNHSLAIMTNGSERMRITSGGIVSIGASDGITTSTYSGKLAVYTAAGANLSIGGGSNTTNGVMSRFVTVNTNNANSGNEGSTSFYGITSIESALTTSNSNASGNSGGYIMFKTKGDAGTLDERMRITSGGNVEINTGSIKTGDPGLGSAGAIKLGQRFSGTAIIPSGYIPIDIDGTTYYINLFEQTP